MGVPRQIQRKETFEGVPPTACWGMENCKELFGLGSDKESLTAAFEAGTDDNRRNLLFGGSGIVSRTLDHWSDLLDDTSRLIERLRAELFKSRAETQKALAEKEKAEGELLITALKLDQTKAELDTAREANDLRKRAMQSAFDQVEGARGIRLAAKGIAATLLSRSPGKNAMTG